MDWEENAFASYEKKIPSVSNVPFDFIDIRNPDHFKESDD